MLEDVHYFQHTNKLVILEIKKGLTFKIKHELTPTLIVNSTI